MANVPNFGYTYPLIEDQYAFKNTKVSSILAFSQSDESFYVFYNDIFNPGFWETIFKYTQDPSKAVFSVKLYPFSYAQTNPSEKKQVKVANNWTPNSMYVYTGLSQFKDLDLGKVTIKPKYNSILDYKPYTSIYLNLPFYGELELDNVVVMGKTLSVHYNVDLLTGSTTIYVDIIKEIPYTILEHDYKGNRTIFTTNIDLGQTLPIMASANYQQFKSGLNAVGEAMLGASMMIGATGTMQEIPKQYKPVDIMEGSRVVGQTKYTDDLSPTQYKRVGEKPYQSYSGARGIYSSLTQASNLSQISHRQIQNAQGGSGWFGSLNMYVRYERHKIIDNKIAKYNGKPLYETRTLYKLRGMTKVENIILDNCPLKEYEKEQLVKYLYNGIIIKDNNLIKFEVNDIKIEPTYKTNTYYFKVEDISVEAIYKLPYKFVIEDIIVEAKYNYPYKFSVKDINITSTYTQYVEPSYKFSVSSISVEATYTNKYKFSVSSISVNSYYYTPYQFSVSSISVAPTYKVYVPTSYKLYLYGYEGSSILFLKTFTIDTGTTIYPSIYANAYIPSGYKLKSYSPTSSFVMTDNTIIRAYYEEDTYQFKVSSISVEPKYKVKEDTYQFKVSSISVEPKYKLYIEQPTMDYTTATEYTNKYKVYIRNNNDFNVTSTRSGSDITTTSVNVYANSFTYFFVDINSSIDRTYNCYFKSSGGSKSSTTTLTIKANS